MPALHTYESSIRHDWEHSGDYYRICEFLDGAADFAWSNLSVPQHDPLADYETLQMQLRNQIRPAECILVLACMYTSRSEWMDWEVAFGRPIGAPVVGIAPWGSQRIPDAVQRSTREIVGWNTDSIVSAVRRHARKG